METPSQLLSHDPRVLFSRQGRLISAEPDGQNAIEVTEPAQPGDDVKANNTLDLKTANGVLGAVRLTVSSAKPTEEQKGPIRRLVESVVPLGSPFVKDQRRVLPSAVSVKAHVTPEYTVYTVGVDFENPWEDRVSAALLQIPRIKGLLLLEERHKAGEVDYLPEVMEKETAKKKFEQAAASETHSATISNADDEFFEVKIDKIAPGATANFTTCLLQPRTVEVEMVVEDGDQDAMVMADVLVTPGVTGVEEGRAVPFTFEVSFSSEYSVAEVPFAVAKDSLDQIKVFDPYHPYSYCLFYNDEDKLPPRSLVVLQPNPENPTEKARFSAPNGVLTASAVLVRLCRKKVNPMLEELTRKMGDVAIEDEGPVKPAKCVVRPNVFFDPKDGSAKHFSNVEITAPSELESVGPCETPHRIFLIVDQSGSTSMRVDGSVTFLEKSVAFLQGMVRTLPRHIEALRRKNAINNKPVTVHLWAFASSTRHHCTVTLPDAPANDMLQELEKDLLKKAGALRSTGCTNYDSFSAELQSVIETTDPHLNHVLLFTDGGATSLQRFEQNVQAMVSHPKATFFQADCLGYGPWLNPATVTFFANATSGEAILVEKPEGEEMRIKLLGLIARSMLRAATTFELAVSGANDAIQVVAVESLDTNSAPAPSTDVLEAKPEAWTLDVVPGQQLRLGIVHGAADALSISVCGVEVPIAIDGAEEAKECKMDTDWEVVPTDDGSGQPLTAAEAALVKIRKLTAAKALGHILLLEPAYSNDVFYPEETASERNMALLRMSIDAQVPAPSVTRGCAVAKLKTSLTPIPEHCRPEEKSQWSQGFALDDGGIKGPRPSLRADDCCEELEDCCDDSSGGSYGAVLCAPPPMAALQAAAAPPPVPAPAPRAAAAVASDCDEAKPESRSRSVAAPRKKAVASKEGQSISGKVASSAAPMKSKRKRQAKRRSRPRAITRPQEEETGPKSFERWMRRSRAGIYEPALSAGASACTLVGSWNFDERLREVLQNIQLLGAYEAEPAKKGDVMDTIDMISAASDQLESMATKLPEFQLGTRSIMSEIQPDDAEQREEATQKMLAQLMLLLRALLLSFVMCSAVQTGAIEIPDAMSFGEASISLDSVALSECEDKTILEAGRAVLAALDGAASA